jgi:DNA adenine methylase
VKYILPIFPKHTCYVEPFAGAAALFFSKPPSKVEVLNDVNGDLVCLYRVVQHHLDEFMRQFRWALSSRQMYAWLQETKPETLTDIQRAARFFYLQKLAFGGKVEGRNYGTSTTAPMRINLLRLEEDLSAAHLRLHQVNIENMDWAACVTRYDRPHTLFYCDPPYWNTEGYGFDFAFENYERLARLARSIQGKMIVSVNDIPEMRRLFSGFQMREVSLNYTIEGRGRASAKSKELIVCNFPDVQGVEVKS